MKELIGQALKCSNYLGKHWNAAIVLAVKQLSGQALKCSNYQAKHWSEEIL